MYPQVFKHGESAMDTAQEDGFVVFARRDRSVAGTPESAERLIAQCPTYEEACQLRRRLNRRARECVIRYVGEVGGGD
jgi:hypothetical protein